MQQGAWCKVRDKRKAAGQHRRKEGSGEELDEKIAEPRMDVRESVACPGGISYLAKAASESCTFALDCRPFGRHSIK